MRLEAEVAGEGRNLELKRDGERVIAEIGGRQYEIKARELAAGVYLLLVNGRVYECRVEEAGAQPGVFDVQLCRRSYRVEIHDPKRLRGSRGTGLQAGGRATIVAQMPGKVVRVLVDRGAQVEAGAGVLIVEAMKMQNEMKAPRAGTVIELHARVGATVNAGEVLAVIE
jgi:biotin carboxyl carrier protein